MASLVGAEYPVLADTDSKVARAYEAFDLLGDGVATPATFIIDKTGNVVLQYVGQNISDRPSNDDILRGLASLEK